MTRTALFAALAGLAALALPGTAMAGEATQPVRAAAEAGAVFKKGDMLHTAAGHRLGRIYRVTPEGDAQVIVNSRMVTVPAAKVTLIDGKLVAGVMSSRELPGGN